MSKLLPFSQTFGDIFDLANDERFFPDLLEWLIRLPLQRVEEVARCLGVPNSSMYDQLAAHQSMGAIDYVVLREDGTRAHRRYYATDRGLYAWALRHNPPYQVSALAQVAPICEQDLHELILHQETLIVLTNLVSRLVSEGRTNQIFHLLHLQHPGALAYRSQGRKHTLISDAFFTLEREDNYAQTFCLFIDGCEQSDQQCSFQHNWLNQLLATRNAFLGQSVAFPYPLIVTTLDRLHIWGNLLAQSSQERREHILPGSITYNSRIEEGAYAPIWWRFTDLAKWSTTYTAEVFKHTIKKVECVSLAHLFNKTPAKPLLYGQRDLQIAELHQQSLSETVPPRERSITQFIRGNFREEAAGISSLHLQPEQLVDSDLTKLFALLTLKLTAQEKSVLALLTRHPLLSIPDLSVLLTPNAKTSRTIGEYVKKLLHLGLLQTYTWDSGPSREERERYKLTESALRFLAERYNIPPFYYLTQKPAGVNLAPDSPKTRWAQRGVAGLEAQDNHTMGFYRCMVAATRIANTKGDHTILLWKSAFESVREYPVPFGYTRSQLRPDGEVCYTAGTLTQPKIFLIEYDRATSENREYEKKFSAYHDYIEATKLIPPPILAITQSTRAADKMRNIAHKIDSRLKIITILEEELLSYGLHLSIERA